MVRNYFALGDRELTGKIGRILAAGDINIHDANVAKLYCAGDVDIRNAYVKKLRAAGDVSVWHSNFGSFKAAGDISITGVCKSDIFVSVGDLSAEYLECKILRNHTKQGKKINNRPPYINKYKGAFKSKTFESFYPIELNFEFEFDNIISNDELFCNHIVECEKFYSFAPVSLEGINADYVYIYPISKSRINVITGTNIKVSSSWRPDKAFKSIPKSISNAFYSEIIKTPPSVMQVGEIEGDSIQLDHVKAESVSGIDVVIGDLCVVDKVEYKSNIRVSDKAIVGEVVKV